MEISEQILEQRDLAAMLKRRDALRKANGLAFYKPHDKQDRFHSAGLFSRRYMRTGNRLGKTTCGVAEDIAWARGERTWYKVPFDVLGRDGTFVRRHDPTQPAHAALITAGIPRRSTKGVIIVQDWDKAKSVFTSEDAGQSRGKIWQLLPESWLEGTDNDRQGNLQRIRIRSIYGEISTIQFETIKSFMQDPQGHESEDWDFVHIDEPCPEEMFTAYARGLVDRGGFAWFMCTPLTQMWINDYFIPRARTRDTFALGQDFSKTIKVADETFTQNYWVITGSIFDNYYLAKSEIAAFIQDIPDMDLDTRIEGRPRALSGAIYTEFHRDVHIYHDTPPGWIDPYTPPEDYCIKISIDPHPSTPSAVLFDAISPGGFHFFYAEIFEHLLIKHLCERILLVPGADRAYQIICDPIAWNEASTGDGTRMVDDFMEGGIFPIPATKDLVRGILKVKAMLTKRCLKGTPILRFSSDLITTSFEFDRFVWDPKKALPHKTCPDHMMECLYRLMLDGTEWFDPSGKPSPVIPPLAITSPQFTLPKVGSDDPVNAILARRDRRYPIGSSLFCPWDPTDYAETKAEDRFKPTKNAVQK